MTRCFFLLLLAAPIFAQSADTVLTQTLITEIRALRQDIQATTVTSQRVQIALYRLQSQTTLVAGAQQRLDAAHTHVSDTQANRRRLAEQVPAIEERIRNTQDAGQKREFEAMVSQMKAEMERMGIEEAQRRSAEVDAEAQFRAEQAKLTDLQSLLDRLDKALDDIARPKR
jgi:hypothetical protein